MIKIDPPGLRKEENSKIKNRKKISGTSTGKESFNTILEEKISFEFYGNINELLIQLKEEENDFLKNQTFFDLNKYKSLVKKILKYINNEGFQTKVLKRIRKDRSDFVIIEKIDNKLIELANELTSNKAFNLLKTIEEIRGLILDLIY